MKIPIKERKKIITFIDKTEQNPETELSYQPMFIKHHTQYKSL